MPNGRWAGINLIGMSFGRLSVVSEHRPSVKYGRRWNCLCSCGKTTSVLTARLTVGKTRSCGCLRGKSRKGIPNLKVRKPDAPMNLLWSQYACRSKNRGRARHLPFLLSKETFKRLTSSNCFYCGTPPSSVSKLRNSTGSVYVYNGLDRIDSLRGYSDDNVVPCCIKCNRAKNDMDREDFYGWVKKVHGHLFGD